MSSLKKNYAHKSAGNRVVAEGHFSVTTGTSYNQCFGSGFIDSGSWSSILGWISIRIQGIDDQKLENIYSFKTIDIFLIKNCNVPYLSLGFYKGRPLLSSVHATGEPFSPQKRTSSTSKHDFFLLFFYFCVSFLPSWIRIRFQIRIHWPDWIRIPSGSGSETLLTIPILLALFSFFLW